MINLEEATYNDHLAIAALHAESWKKNYRGIYTDHYLDTEVDKDRENTWQHRLQHPKPNQHVIMALDAKKLVGFCCVFLDDHPDFGSLLDNLHVSTLQRKSGVGRLLMQECASIIHQNAQSPSMYLWVYDINTNARQFYDRLGGVNLGVEQVQNKDGSFAPACRYYWKNSGILIDNSPGQNSL